MNATQIAVHIFWMIQRDMPEVLAIENAHCASTTEKELLARLRRRNVIGMVAEHGEKILGFMIYELHKKWIGINHFAVHQDYLRQGIGEQMMNKLKSKLTIERRNRIKIIVRETNLDGRLFLRAEDFVALKTLRENYRDMREDVYLMEYEPFAED